MVCPAAGENSGEGFSTSWIIHKPPDSRYLDNNLIQVGNFDFITQFSSEEENTARQYDA